VEDENAALKTKLTELAASHAAAKEAIAALNAENASLKAQAASTLTEILAAVSTVTTGAMEILPVRPDSRQFVEWRMGGIPPPPPFVPRFDRAWCAAVCADGWKADVDVAAGDMRVMVTQKGLGDVTLRSATPLPRGPSPCVGPGGRQQLPAYRVIVEAHNDDGWCRLGFVPSHHTHGGIATAAVAATPQYGIHNYGGWYILVYAASAGNVHSTTLFSGWTVMTLADSAYATTNKVPPVPAGGAVEFAVDYAAGTCRVAFYTPAAVAGGFAEAPHAKMELRFVATAAGAGSEGRPIPARTVPTAADSGVALYPAVLTLESGTIWRFAVV
jgi:hypothetical protein